MRPKRGELVIVTVLVLAVTAWLAWVLDETPDFVSSCEAQGGEVTYISGSRVCEVSGKAIEVER